MISQLLPNNAPTGGGAALVPPAASPNPVPDQGQPEAADAGAAPAGLADFPPVKAILAGQPPAVRASTEQPNAGALFIAQNIPALGQLGLGLYRGKDSVVLFNPKIIQPDQMKELDKAGKLDALAPDIATLVPGAQNQPEGQPPADASQTPPDGSQTPGGGQPQSEAAVLTPDAPAPSTAGIRPSPVKSQAMRIQDLQPVTPSQRPAPGQGLILNGLLRRAA